MPTDRTFPRRHRLPRSAYEEKEAAFHLTIRAFAEKAPFVGPVGAAVWTVVASEHEGDRVTLLVRPANLDLVGWCGSLKSLTTNVAWQCGWRGRLWQPSFFDRRVRAGSDFDATVAYLRNNPMSARLASEPEEWPWLGVWVE